MPVGDLSHFASRRRSAEAWGDALAATAEIDLRPHRLLPTLLQDIAAGTPDRLALLSNNENLSFGELSCRIDHYCIWAMREKLGKGQCVALMMSNRPEYLAAWLGLTKAGVVVALINTNLIGPTLRHSLSAASPTAIVAETCFLQSVKQVLASGIGTIKPKLYCSEDMGFTASANALYAQRNGVWPSVSIHDPALLIFTSGTSGMPKAAKVSHRRILGWALWFKGLLGNCAEDRMYDCLPLFHSVGGVVAATAPLVAGGSTVVAQSFTSKEFWNDIRRWRATQFQYIGEICRYLLAAPPAKGELDHSLRLICGNGLREDVWHLFQKRFGIPQIVEFYAATEGSFSLYNVEGLPGAVGRIPSYLRHRFPAAIVKYDPNTGLPARDANGRCIRCALGEAGEVLGSIGMGDGSGRFEGYTDAVATQSKILCDVFKPGDQWFRTGDLMRQDAAGYFYFVDRVGDTYRWKGENISTLEVANALARAPGVVDVTVYGVQVPHADGKAGMALVIARSGFTAEALFAHAAGCLPPYAVPVFLRVGAELALTDTFKHRKQDLVLQGFDPAACDGDNIYVRVGRQDRLENVTPTLFARIARGDLRL